MLGPVTAVAALLPGCTVGYVVRSAWFQGELLASRRPVDEVRASGRLDAAQLHALDIIADVKEFGAEIGLSSTDNYESVAIGWDRQVWNLSACAPLAFESKTWWFPVVGRVPYLGYFREQDARATEARLQREGYDVYVRTAGAWSTLGWFRDPILPAMLGWDEFDLADTVLHELAHATVWVRGSVNFNESFATFTGEEAAFRYLAARHGPDAELTVAAHRDAEDRRRWRGLLHGLYRDLDAIYTEPGLEPTGMASAKASLFAGLDVRIDNSDLFDKDRHHRAVARGTWNNARMAQFRTYNDSRPQFEALLAWHQGDLLAFMRDVQDLTRGQKDPFDALRARVVTLVPPVVIAH